MQLFENLTYSFIINIPLYKLTFQCGCKNNKHFSVFIAKMQLLSILAEFLRGHLLAPHGDPGSNPAEGEIFFPLFQLKNDQKRYKICKNTRPSPVCPSLGLYSHANLELVKLAILEGLETFSKSATRWLHFVFQVKRQKSE